MARVAHQKSAKHAGPSSGVRGAKVSKQRKNHKVVIESDVQGKDEKSRAVLSFHAEPPAGYTFIPAGNPQLTAALKEYAKKHNHQIFAVTTTPHASRHELSREVHRIGFHFPTEVVAQVCNHYGIRLTSGGKLVEEKDDDKLFMRLYQKGQLALDEQVRDQVTINTEAKQIIKDLFPNIPDNDLFQIIKTAFQLGDGKVGTADEIPLVRRAQLSVVAHIRHTYTNYDKLLRAVPYSEARHRVESITLQKLIDWRGDDQNDKQAMDDTLREVVVISDEGDTDDEVEEGQVLEHQDLRVQPVNGSARTNNIGSGRARSPIEVHSEDEAPRGYRFVPQVVRRYPVQDPQAISVARQQSRYAVWDRVRQEYRGGNAVPQPRVVERILLDKPPVTSAPVSYTTREPIYVPELPARMVVDPAARIISQSSTSTYVRGADGKLYERILTNPEPIAPSTTVRRMYTPPSTERHRQYVESRPVSPRLQLARIHARNDSFDNDGTIVPSIESPGGVYSASTNRRNPFDDARPPLGKRHSGAFELGQRQAPVIDLTRSAEQASKRRRIGDTPPHSSWPDDPAPNGHGHEEARHDPSHRLIETTLPPPQQRLIPLDNPAAGFERPSTYDRLGSRMQPGIVYREELPSREMLPPPQGADMRPLPGHSAREPYYIQSPRRGEYFNGHDRQLAQPHVNGVRQYFPEEPIHGATDRIGRVILEDVPLQRQPSAYRADPAVNYVRAEAANAPEPSVRSQYYVRELPPAHYQQREHVSSIVPQYPPVYRDVRATQHQVDQTPQQSTRTTQPQSVVYR